MSEQACFHPSRPSTCVPRGSRILFLGDSVTRYQYLSLVYLLQRGVPLASPDATYYSSKIHHPLVGQTWSSWDEFFETTTADLAPHEICDCFRAWDWKAHRKSHIDMFENRFFFSPRMNVSVTFISVFGFFPLTGRLWPIGSSLPSKNQAHTINLGRRSALELFHNRTLSDCFVPFNWRLSWVDSLSHFVRGLAPAPPNIILMNSGHWGPMGFRHAEFIRVLRHYARRITKCAIWQTTTPLRNSTTQGGDAVPRMLFKNRIFDTAEVLHHLRIRDYIDNVHFVPSVYNLLNERLLHHLHTSTCLM